MLVLSLEELKELKDTINSELDNAANDRDIKYIERTCYVSSAKIVNSLIDKKIKEVEDDRNSTY